MLLTKPQRWPWSDQGGREGRWEAVEGGRREREKKKPIRDTWTGCVERLRECAHRGHMKESTIGLDVHHTLVAGAES